MSIDFTGRSNITLNWGLEVKNICTILSVLRYENATFGIEEPRSMLRGMFFRTAEPTGNVLAIAVQKTRKLC